MKTINSVTKALAILLLTAVQLCAQTNNLEETKAKAEKGDAQAQYEFGNLYWRREGVDNKPEEAVKWFRKAAEQGNAGGQYALGLCYIYGDGVEHDPAEGVKWLQKSADQNFSPAQFNLGSLYLEGESVTQNLTKAVELLRKAAEQGVPPAQSSLGHCYMEGKGVREDYTKAVKWFRKAAETGFISAQNNLGVCYQNGQGVPKDFIQSYKWYNLASGQGDEHAKSNLAAIERKMTIAQIAEAQQLVRAFKPKKEIEPGTTISPDAIVESQPDATGTGFFITDDGYLISNYHVVKGAAKVRLLTGAGLIDATVVKVDAANDLALLKANAEGRMKNAETFRPLPIAASRTVKLGGTVATVGFPATGLQGFSPKLAKGEIASLAGAADDPRYFQISLPVQHGNSGGALVDVHGNVVGIVAARLGVEIGKAVTSDELPENVNYAVKSSLLLSFLESVPEVAAKLKEPNTKEESFEEVVKSAQSAAVLVLVY